MRCEFLCPAQAGSRRTRKKHSVSGGRPNLRTRWTTDFCKKLEISREEFDALPAAELQRMVEDPVLTKFIFEDRRYKPDELVGIVKRIKEWGSTNSGEEGEYVDS